MAKKTAFHIKFKDKTSQQWFKSSDFNDKEEMLKHYWNKVRASSCEVEFHGPGGKITEGLEEMTTVKEYTAMDVVDAAITGDASTVKDAFTDLLDTAIGNSIDAMRPEVHSAMFDAPIAEDGPSDEERIADQRKHFGFATGVDKDSAKDGKATFKRPVHKEQKPKHSKAGKALLQGWRK